MASRRSKIINSNKKNILVGLILVIISMLIGFYLGTHNLSKSNKVSESELKNIKSNTQVYSNSEYGFSFQYPDGSIIDSSSNPDLIVKVLPPAEYYLAETQLAVKTIKDPYGESVDKMIKDDLADASTNLYTGVLKGEIDGLPAKRFYTITCPNLGSNCTKTNKYYVSAKDYTYIITTDHHTDADLKPINENITEGIISTINFTN